MMDSYTYDVSDSSVLFLSLLKFEETNFYNISIPSHTMILKKTGGLIKCCFLCINLPREQSYSVQALVSQTVDKDLTTYLDKSVVLAARGTPPYRLPRFHLDICMMQVSTVGQTKEKYHPC